MHWLLNARFFFSSLFHVTLHLLHKQKSIYLVSVAKKLPLLEEGKKKVDFFFVSESNKCFVASSIIVPQKCEVSVPVTWAVCVCVLYSSICLSIYHHTLSSQKKKKMATKRKRESCQLLLPLLRLPLPWCSPAYWSDGRGRKGEGWKKIVYDTQVLG